MCDYRTLERVKMLIYNIFWYYKRTCTQMSNMVLLKTFVAEGRTREIENYKNHINNKMDELDDMMSDMDDVRRLKSIAFHIDKLCKGKKTNTEEELVKKREANKRLYKDNKDTILEAQKERRKKVRQEKNDFISGVQKIVEEKIVNK